MSGLIPAWAGKTAQAHCGPRRSRAHPRVGGENETATTLTEEQLGSSPRGRGKPVRASRCLARLGLIPAWAGKTRRSDHGRCDRAAHPRVGGENTPRAPRPPGRWGSSPRGRGKPRSPVHGAFARGLIPAWAGKTPSTPGISSSTAAHPRVGGENILVASMDWAAIGSSPRGRGKHFLTCAFIERIGQILETLELAVSSESYTLSAAYATDAPQDQARNTALVLPSSRGAS